MEIIPKFFFVLSDNQGIHKKLQTSNILCNLEKKITGAPIFLYQNITNQNPTISEAINRNETIQQPDRILTMYGRHCTQGACTFTEDSISILCRNAKAILVISVINDIIPLATGD